MEPQTTPAPVAQPEQQATTPVAQPQRQHVHHSYIWLGSIRMVGFIIFFLIIGSAGSISSLVEAATSPRADAIVIPIILGILLLSVMVIFGIAAGLTALAYKNLYYEVGPTEFSLYSGIISKKRVHVPYQRIQSVDQKASLLQRVFGVCNVSIDTAGGAANKAVLVPYLTNQQADALRSELYARKVYLEAEAAGAQPVVAQPQPAAPQAATTQPAAAQPVATRSTMPQATVAQPTTAQPTAAQPQRPGNVLDAGANAWNRFGGVFAGDDVFLGPVTYEYGLSNKELIFTGLSNNSSFFLAVMIVIAFVLQASSMVFDIIPGSENAVFDGIASTALNYGIMQVSLVICLSLIGIAIFVWVLSTLGACIQFGGFKARRRGSRIEVERGLLQHVTQSVSIDRVQSVIIKQTLIRRILGYCELSLGKIDAMEESNNSEQSVKMASQGLIIHPFIKRAKAQEVLAGIIPEFADAPREMRSVSKKALRRGIIRQCFLQGGGFWLAVVVAIVQIAVGALEPYMDLEDILFTFSLLPIFAILYALAAIMFVKDVIATVLWARGSGFAYNRRFMTVMNSGLSTHAVSFPRNKIQFGFSRTNPFQRLAKTASIVAVTAAGVGGTFTQLVDVEDEAADEWLTWLEPYEPVGSEQPMG